MSDECLITARMIENEVKILLANPNGLRHEELEKHRVKCFLNDEIDPATDNVKDSTILIDDWRCDVRIVRRDLTWSIDDFRSRIIVPIVEQFRTRSWQIKAADETELELLKDFYQLWVAMHAIKTDELHKRKKQQAAQDLWDQSIKLKNFYLPTIASQLQ